MVEKVSNALDTAKIVVGVFPDLKIAFDTVNHDILHLKIYAYGIRGNMYDWFKRYLKNRKQYVLKIITLHHI